MLAPLFSSYCGVLLCRPLVLEEFGLTKRFFTLRETKVVFAVVADALIAAKRAGKPFMGAWLWQAAPVGKLPQMFMHMNSITSTLLLPLL
jgi:hypothetical protein